MVVLLVEDLLPLVAPLLPPRPLQLPVLLPLLLLPLVAVYHLVVPTEQQPAQVVILLKTVSQISVAPMLRVQTVQ